MDAETQKKLEQMQLIEQQVQNLSSQKQEFQVRLSQSNSAMEHLEGKDDAYKIVGSLMVKEKADKLRRDLEKETKALSMKIEKLEKQEDKLGEKAQKLQKEVLKNMGGKNE